MRDIDDVLIRLSKSTFRQRFKLRKVEQAYLARKGLCAMREHAHGFVTKRLAMANPPDDGNQTPMKGHPVFVAQHATATCCRGCLAKWHGIPKGRPIEADEQTYIVAVLDRWLSRQVSPDFEASEPRLL
jgi:hypothetical protein